MDQSLEEVQVEKKAAKKKTALQVLLDERGEKPLPTKKESVAVLKALKQSFEDRQAAIAEADRIVNHANAAVEAAARGAIMLLGRERITIGSSVYEPTCHGEAVFYKKVGEEVKFGI
jgi:hypothetical protein